MAKAVARKAAHVVDAIDVEFFTTREASQGFGDLDQAVQAVRDLAGKAAKVQGAAMWNGAMVAHNVLSVNRGDYIGKPEDGKPWKDQGAFVEAMGFSAGYGTKLRNLGRAAVVHKITRGSSLWTFLVSNVGNGKVSAAIRLEDSDEAKRLLSQYQAELREHGKITGDARTPQVGDGTENGGENGGGETPEETVAKRPATAEDLFAALEAMASAASDVEWADAFEPRLVRMLEKNILGRFGKDDGRAHLATLFA